LEFNAQVRRTFFEGAVLKVRRTFFLESMQGYRPWLEFNAQVRRTFFEGAVLKVRHTFFLVFVQSIVRGWRLTLRCVAPFSQGGARCYRRDAPIETP
jgi:hypothetical protein